jgi:hypothetical protein
MKHQTGCVIKKIRDNNGTAKGLPLDIVGSDNTDGGKLIYASSLQSFGTWHTCSSWNVLISTAKTRKSETELCHRYRNKYLSAVPMMLNKYPEPSDTVCSICHWVELPPPSFCLVL